MRVVKPTSMDVEVAGAVVVGSGPVDVVLCRRCGHVAVDCSAKLSREIRRSSPDWILLGVDEQHSNFALKPQCTQGPSSSSMRIA